MKLEEIEAMLEAATPGPWEYEQNGKRGAWIGNSATWAALSCGNTDEEAINNAHLIASAPTIIKELVERVRLLEDVLGRCESLADNGVDDPAGPYNVLQQVVNTICAVLYAKEQDDASNYS